MEHEKERLWWLPLVHRMVVWGLVMALLWGWIPLLCSGALEFGRMLWGINPFFWDPFPDPSGFIISVGLYYGCLWMAGGLITGAFAGFFAPVTESRNPLKSIFFRRVGRRTFWFWFWSTSLVTLGFSLLALGVVWVMDSMAFGMRSRVLDSALPLVAMGIYGLSQVALPVLALWRGLNMELKEVRGEGD